MGKSGQTSTLATRGQVGVAVFHLVFGLLFV